MSGKTFTRTARQDKIFFNVELDSGELLRFDCRDQVPGGIVLGVSKLAGDGGDTQAERIKQGAAAITLIQKLLRAAIMKPQQAKFWAMVEGEDEDGMIDMPQMVDIAMALAEVYTERPTGTSSETGSPRTTDGSSSTDGAPPEVLTYSRSPQSALTT